MKTLGSFSSPEHLNSAPIENPEGHGSPETLGLVRPHATYTSTLKAWLVPKTNSSRAFSKSRSRTLPTQPQVEKQISSLIPPPVSHSSRCSCPQPHLFPVWCGWRSWVYVVQMCVWVCVYVWYHVSIYQCDCHSHILLSVHMYLCVYVCVCLCVYSPLKWKWGPFPG